MDSEIEEVVRSLLVPVCDVYEDDSDFDENQIWEPRRGDALQISEMTDSHLINSLRWWKDWYRPDFYRYSLAHPNNNYEKFADIYAKLKGGKRKAFDKYMVNVGHTRAMHFNPKYKYLWEEVLKRGLINESQ
jgi:hypothetical protein